MQGAVFRASCSRARPKRKTSGQQRRPSRRALPRQAQGSWNPFRLRGSPFFEDKNRAFWTLQSIGWAGYFLLRTLGGIANEMGWIYVLHTLLLTATGYSVTLLMASAYRRLIRMRPIYTWVGSIAIVIVASVRLLGDRDLERRHLHPAGDAARRASGSSAPS